MEELSELDRGSGKTETIRKGSPAVGNNGQPCARKHRSEWLGAALSAAHRWNRVIKRKSEAALMPNLPEDETK